MKEQWRTVWSKHQDHLPVLFAAFVLVACIGKQPNVDDYIYIQVAKNIAKDVLDPFAGLTHWDTTYRPLFEVNENPPLLSYLLALAGSHTNWSVPWMHAILLPGALAGVRGVASLARLVGAHPARAQWGLVLSSFWLVSATSLMCEVTMTSIAVWASVAVVRSTQSPERGAAATWALLGGLLIGVAFMTKYSAVFVAVGLGLHLLVKRGFRVETLAFCLGFLVLFGCLEGGMMWRYGESKFIDAAFYPSSTQQGGGAGVRFICTVMFFGAGALPILMTRWLSFSRRMLLGVFLISILAPFFMYFITQKDMDQYSIEFSMLAFSLHSYSFFVAGALVFVAFALRRRDALDQPLVLIISVVFVLFTLHFNWCVNARSVLPALPFLSVWWSLKSAESSAQPPRVVRCALPVLAALCSLAVLHGDMTWSSYTERTAVLADAFARDNGGKYSFAGHWGFQYQMEKLGYQPLDFEQKEVSERAFVFAPSSYSGQDLSRGYVWVDGFADRMATIFSTFDVEARTSFYGANAITAFPFSFSTRFEDRLHVFRVVGPNAPAERAPSASRAE